MLLAALAPSAHADPLDDAAGPPSSVQPTPVLHARRDPFAVAERWGGGVRVTGLSGIGALPGVNYGGEIAARLRRDELFGELALAWWKPEKKYVVTEMPEHVELGLDVWSLRAGWASMRMPLRAWGLVEVGELASSRAMAGVVTRAMMGDTPQSRQWRAIGGGMGVAWPMSDNLRLFGMLELAIPVERKEVALDTGPYQPDALAVRSSLGLEVGWR